MITFKIEPWEIVSHVLKPMIREHWVAVDEDHATVPLDPDFARFDETNADSNLVLIIGRADGGKIAAYVVVVIAPHWHYKSTKYGFVGALWLDPAYRTAATGLNMIAVLEATMHDAGVVKVVSASKVRDDINIAPIYEYMGWRKAEVIYEKVITV